jgi:acyl carrier protein
MQSAFDAVVFEKVSRAVGQVVRRGKSDLSPATRLSDDLALGRFGRLKLAICLEEAFDVELEDEDVEQFTVVGDIVSYISHRYFRDVDFAAA